MTMLYYHATEIAGYVLDFYKTTFNFGGKRHLQQHQQSEAAKRSIFFAG